MRRVGPAGFPHAFTYFRSVATDGECFPVTSARSRRAMAGPCVPHSLRHLRLSKTGLLPGFQQRVEKLCCLSFDTLNLGAHTGSAHEALDQLIMCFH